MHGHHVSNIPTTISDQVRIRGSQVSRFCPLSRTCIFHAIPSDIHSPNHSLIHSFLESLKIRYISIIVLMEMIFWLNILMCMYRFEIVLPKRKLKKKIREVEILSSILYKIILHSALKPGGTKEDEGRFC